MPPRGRIEVDERYCKGCSLCVGACPTGLLGLDPARLTPKGYHPAGLIKDGCTGCALCAMVCPEAAISVFRQVAQKEVQPPRPPIGERGSALQRGSE